MNDYFDLACSITRNHARAIGVEDYPPLNPAEHLWIEDKLGRELTNSEAQEALKDALLLAAFSIWAGGRP